MAHIAMEPSESVNPDARCWSNFVRTLEEFEHQSGPFFDVRADRRR